MRRRTLDALRSIAATVVAALVTLLLLPEPATAQWDDRSDELPGYDISATTIIVGAAIVVGAVFLIRHLTRDDDEENEATEAERDASALDLDAMAVRPQWPASAGAATPIPFDLVIGTHRDVAGAGSALDVGVRFRVGASGIGARK